MTPSDYEKFQQRMFDELDELEGTALQSAVEKLSQAGHQCGIDVIAEIVDKGRPANEVIEEVKAKKAMLEIGPPTSDSK